MAKADSITAIVRQMHPPRYTVTDAARKIGRSTDTLRRWRIQGLCEPSERRTFGSINVHLYTDEDIEVLRNLALTQRAGRKPVGDPSLSPPIVKKKPIKKKPITKQEERSARKSSNRQEARRQEGSPRKGRRPRQEGAGRQG